MISLSLPYFEQILPLDASCWEIEVDPEMSMLDDWITKQIASNLCSPAEYQNKRLGLLARRTSRAHHSAPLKYVYEQPVHSSLTKLAAASQEPTVLILIIISSNYYYFHKFMLFIIIQSCFSFSLIFFSPFLML